MQNTYFKFGYKREITCVEELISDLLDEIGLGIRQDGTVYDTDNDIDIKCDQKLIKASVNPARPMYPNDVYVVFDPVFDDKFMSMIFSYYINKNEAKGELDIFNFAKQIEPQTTNKWIKMRSRRSRIVATGRDGTSYNGRFYYQGGLKYSDLILRIGGTGNIDPDSLWRLDSIPDEPIEQYYITQPKKRVSNIEVCSGGNADDNIARAMSDINGTTPEDNKFNYWGDSNA